MIDGFKIRMTHEELANHCSRKADSYNTRVAEAEAELANVDPNSQKAASLSYDVRANASLARDFRLYSTHLFCVDYALTENDMRYLEIVSGPQF
jgi:hypothetical protein